MPQRPRTYVDKVKRTVLCVLNDTEAGRPGHRDWSVFWKVERSLAWGAWVGLAKGNYVSQKVLAEFLEDWRHTVVAPDAATLMAPAASTQRITERPMPLDESTSANTTPKPLTKAGVFVPGT